MTTAADLAWWQKTIAYEVYPKSFLDTRGQGTGTIAGITAKLDYLASLGVGAIWITPCYKSPMVDNGYDIEDYYQIDPSFGSMADMDALIARGRRLPEFSHIIADARNPEQPAVLLEAVQNIRIRKAAVLQEREHIGVDIAAPVGVADTVLQGQAEGRVHTFPVLDGAQRAAPAQMAGNHLPCSAEQVCHRLRNITVRGAMIPHAAEAILLIPLVRHGIQRPF